MPLYRPTELQQFLSQHGLRPKRTLSQNFLIDGNIVSKIVREVGEPKSLIEVGAGPGVLTEAFLSKGLGVLAIEKDDGFAKALQRFVGVEVVHADVLTVSFDELLGRCQTPVSVVSNVPYHLTTPILAQLLHILPRLQKAVVMVQEEVARKLVRGRSSAMGVIFSVLCAAQYVCSVPKNCFWPKPSVDSAVISISDRGTAVDREEFISFVSQVFRQPRKAIKICPAPRLLALGLSPLVRPEEIPHPLWLPLFRACHCC